MRRSPALQVPDSHCQVGRLPAARPGCTSTRSVFITAYCAQDGVNVNGSRECGMRHTRGGPWHAWTPSPRLELTTAPARNIVEGGPAGPRQGLRRNRRLPAEMNDQRAFALQGPPLRASGNGHPATQRARRTATVGAADAALSRPVTTTAWMTTASRITAATGAGTATGLTGRRTESHRLPSRPTAPSRSPCRATCR